MDHRNGKYRKAAAIIAVVFLVGLTTASFLPLFETNIWWIRFMDFPRVQLAIALIVLLAVYLGLRRRPSPPEWIVVVGVVAALGYHVYKLHPYSEFVEPATLMGAECQDGQRVRIMIANVKRKNKSADAFLDQVAVVDPDLLLILETDTWWHKRLVSLHGAFQHRMQNLPEEQGFYGMHLLSKLELISPNFSFFFGADTPTAVTQIRLPDGNTIGFIGLHPKPPLAWSRPTTMRDAHILQAALMARASRIPTIVAGDFNAVPWERVTRRALRIGGLLDPRVGRGLFATYDTGSYLISWPLDQILFQQQLRLRNFDRLPDFGSDHRAVVATLCHDPAAARHLPTLGADDLAKAEASIQAARRAE